MYLARVRESCWFFSTILRHRFSNISAASGAIAPLTRESSSASEPAERIAVLAPAPAVGMKPTAASPQSRTRPLDHSCARASAIGQGKSRSAASIAVPIRGSDSTKSAKRSRMKALARSRSAGSASRCSLCMPAQTITRSVVG